MDYTSSLTPFQMTGINPRDYGNSLEISQKFWHNRARIRAAYLRDLRYATIGEPPNNPGYCLWSGCTNNRKATHVHLHRADTGTCEWDWCSNTELHIHKYKPMLYDQAEEIDPTGRYESVKDISKEILGDQYVVRTEWRSAYEQLEMRNAAEEAEKEKKRKRVEEAERKGDEAAREYQERIAARRARKAAEQKRAENAAEAKRRRVAGRASMRREIQGGNELERHFDEVELTPSRLMGDSLETTHSSHARSRLREIEQSSPQIENGKGLSAIAAGKQKRAASPITVSSLSDGDDDDQDHTIEQHEAATTFESATSDLTLFDLDDLDEFIKQAEAEFSPKSQTSALTQYTREELDAILAGVDVIEEGPEQEFPPRYVLSTIFPRKASVYPEHLQDRVPGTPPFIQVHEDEVHEDASDVYEGASDVYGGASDVYEDSSEGEVGGPSNAAQDLEAQEDMPDAAEDEDTLDTDERALDGPTPAAAPVLATDPIANPMLNFYDEDKENWHEENGVFTRLGPRPTSPSSNIFIPPEMEGDLVDQWIRGEMIKDVMRDAHRPWRERRQWRFEIFEDT